MGPLNEVHVVACVPQAETGEGLVTEVTVATNSVVPARSERQRMFVTSTTV